VEETANKKKLFSSLSLTKEELERQVADYKTLKVYESARGIPLLILVAMFAWSFGLTQFYPELFTLADMLVSILMYVPFMVFTYFGHRWGIVGLLTLYTFDKWYIMAFTGSVITSLIFWGLVSIYLYRALQVENERKRQKEVVLPLEAEA
tara:strand:- start:1589 stop:2038 length:450 start_codon:yes stop_codon:yes gene_type:complete